MTEVTTEEVTTEQPQEETTLDKNLELLINRTTPELLLKHMKDYGAAGSKNYNDLYVIVEAVMKRAGVATEYQRAVANADFVVKVDEEFIGFATESEAKAFVTAIKKSPRKMAVRLLA